MWCCSRTAKVLFDSVIGFGGDPVVPTSDSERNNVSGNTKTVEISLDAGYIGHEVVIVKNGLRICGSGGSLGSSPLVQTKSYFEVKFQQEGRWGVGLATRNASLNKGPLGEDTDSWILRNTAELCHNGQSIGKLEQMPQEGDIIGISYDHIELNFYVNGVKANISFSNVRGTVFPALYVDEGAVLDAIFEGFTYPPPPGFDKIMKEKTIL